MYLKPGAKSPEPFRAGRSRVRPASIYRRTSQASRTAAILRIRVHRGIERAGLRRLLVDVHHANRAGLVPPEREVRDVDAVVAEDRADLADDARLIVVRR